MSAMVVPIEEASKVIAFIVDIPEDNLGLELLIQCRFEDGLLWAANYQNGIPFVFTMTRDCFQWRFSGDNLEPQTVTTQFNAHEIFHFMRLCVFTQHCPPVCLVLHIDFDGVFIDFYDKDAQQIVVHHEGNALRKVHGLMVDNSTYDNWVQQFSNPRPFLKLSLHTDLLRKMMKHAEETMTKYGSKHDLPLSFIVFSKMMFICAGEKYIWLDQDAADNNEESYRVLRIKCNWVPAIFKALQLADWVDISNMPPMLKLKISKSVYLTVYIPLESLCNPQSVPAIVQMYNFL